MFYDIYADLCQKKGITKTRAALEIGLSNATPTKWKNTGATPDGATLQKIADYFGVSVGYLLGTEDKKIEPTVAGGLGALIPGYDELSVEHKADAIRYIEFLLQKQKGEDV